MIWVHEKVTSIESKKNLVCLLFDSKVVKNCYPAILAHNTIFVYKIRILETQDTFKRKNPADFERGRVVSTSDFNIT